MVVRIKEVKTEHLAQRLSIRKKERDYGEEVAGDSKGFQVFSFCRMTKSNLGRKVFISFSISRPQFLFGGSQEETHSRNLESGTMEELLLTALLPSRHSATFLIHPGANCYRQCYPQWTGLSCINYQSRRSPLASV